MQEEKDVQPERVAVENEGPNKATIFIAVLVLGLLAGAASVPALWILVILMLPKPVSEFASRNVLYVVALLDVVFCVWSFRRSRLFIVSFALGATVSLGYCALLSSLAEAVPD